MTDLKAVEVGHLEPAEAIDIFIRSSKVANPATNIVEESAPS